MKMVFAVFLASIPLTAFAQIESGTFVTLESSQNEIVVAADSRSIIDGKELDDSCKIRALGNELIFSTAGEAGVVNKWDSFTIAENLFRRLSQEKAAEPVPIRLANAWGNEVKSKLKAQI